MSWRNLLDTTFPEIMTTDNPMLIGKISWSKDIQKKVAGLLKSYRLSRRGSQHQVDDQLLWQLILQELDGPGRLLGYLYGEDCS